MPRMQPPKGFITSKEAQARLNVSDSMLRKYVGDHRLNRYGPVGSKNRPWYRESEIEALYFSQQMLEEAPVKRSYKNNPTSTFELATESDMPAIIAIDTATFKHPAASLETCLSWFRKNPHTFYVLKNEQGVVQAYASLIPMDKALIDQFVRDELDGEDLTAEMIGEYVSGVPIDIYVMAIATHPDCTHEEKRRYGGHLILGLLELLFELADQGIDVRTITARNYMRRGELELPDGLRLLRKMGFTQVKSPVSGLGLFVINIPESGIAIFERYSAKLAAWKGEHEEQSA